MRKLIIASIVSFAAGAGAVYAINSGLTVKSDDSAAARVADPSRALADTALSAAAGSYVDRLWPVPGVAERARVYDSVASAGAGELRAMAVDALERANRSGPHSTFELDVVFARLIEIDPDAALVFVRDQNLDAVRALNFALSMLDILGYSEQLVDDLLAALPQLDRDQFRTTAVERLADVDPAQALRAALAVTESSSITAGPAFGFSPWQARPQLLMRIGATWAARDPLGALAAIESIADMNTRLVFAQGVVNRIAQSDPDFALAYLESSDVPDSQKMVMVQAALQQVAAQDPVRAIRYAERLGGQTAQTAQMMAVQLWARRDAPAALAYVEAMPVGMLRQTLLQQVASAYASNDPEAALSWVRSLTEGQARAYAGVLAGIAQVDPMRALDLVLDTSQVRMPRTAQMSALIGVMTGVARSGSVSYRVMADRLVTLGNGQLRQSALRMLGQMWPSTDVDGALDWFMNNQEAVGRDTILNLAQQLARQDPQSAAQYSARVRPELRPQWITAVASGYAQYDATGAQAWIQQFRGDPVYESAVAEVIRFSAGADPGSAATLWESVNFSDRAREMQLASAIAGNWAGQDWQASRNWVVSLRPGEVRDSALTGMMRARQEIPDDALLGLFSNEDRRTQAIMNVVMQAAQFDPELARAMVDEHFDERSQREQAERMIESVESRQNAVIGSQRLIAPAIGFENVTVVR